VNSTLDMKQVAFVGDNFIDLVLRIYADSDFAGDKTDSKSTSGVYAALHGPRSHVPTAALSRKQKAVSHHTAESELAALDLAVRKDALPLMQLLLAINGIDPVVLVEEDNAPAIIIVEKAKLSTIRHMNRTHRVNVRGLHDTFKREHTMLLRKIGTNDQAADMFTKPFTNEEKWKVATDMISQYGGGLQEAISTISKNKGNIFFGEAEAFEAQRLRSEQIGRS
jgi:hypothetical protein